MGFTTFPEKFTFMGFLYFSPSPQSWRASHLSLDTAWLPKTHWPVRLHLKVSHGTCRKPV